MNGLRAYVSAFMLGVAVIPGRAASLQPGDVAPSPVYPSVAAFDREKGTVVVKVHAAKDGTIDSCTVIRSSGFKDLDDSTVTFIRKNWRLPSEAGNSIEVPISYGHAEIPFGTPEVPNLLRPGEASITMDLYVSFDSDGYIKALVVSPWQSHTEIQNRIFGWLYAHWRTKDYQHQTVRVQLHFDPPPAAK